ncbi:MAG: prefoldin subunit alpha [Thermoprotei archaeon]|nr:MAG: prefoldin subunit alpha [Thermoprotei archaeon]RLE82278.1 MAG: prefoldin subunit alpha [Thermoprotei archaeon]RLF02954.1 MAG: prefoldin subunit alpha [Thermoprotei archaeon]
MERSRVSQQIQQLIERYSFLEELARQLEERLKLLETLYNELTTTISVVEEIGKMDSERDTLVPIGSSVYVFARIKEVDKVLLGVGANVFLEKKPEEAVEHLMVRRNEVVKELGNLRNQLSSVLGELEKIRGILQSLSRAP